MLTPRLTFLWQDNQGNRCQHYCWLPAGLDVAALVARANAIRGPMRAASNAVLLGAEIRFDNFVEPAGTIQPGSDVRRSSVLFFQDAAGAGSWRVPSPRLDLVDQAGEWRGFRLSRAALVAAGLVDDLEAAAALTAFSWGDQFPSTFTVGSLDYTVP